MVFHKNYLPADDSHEISCLFVIFEKRKKKKQHMKLASTANYRWRFMGLYDYCKTMDDKE